MRMHGFLFRSAPACLKSISLVLWPATRKITPVIRIPTTTQGDFITIIDQGRAPGCEQTGEGQSPYLARRAWPAHEPADIKPAEKSIQHAAIHVVGISGKRPLQ